MKDALVGYTGFVGGNLHLQHQYSKVYNTKNIHEIKGEHFDVLVCAGVKAQKWYANTHPEEDLNDILNLIEIFKHVRIDRFVLISTIDVYPVAKEVDENSFIDENTLEAYGKNRLFLENWVRKTYEHHHIVRLPGLFGEGLKKNFIYDFLHPMPKMINENSFKSVYDKLSTEEKLLLSAHYQALDKNYYWDQINSEQLLPILKKNHATSLMFTDSNDQLQYYPLSRITNDIQVIIQNNLCCVNLATEPIKISELHYFLTGTEFINNLSRPKQNYDMKTLNAKYFNVNGKYIMTKQEVFQDIADFVKGYKE